MKVSNSKKELARIINENGGWRDGANWAAQDKDGKALYHSPKPSIGKGNEERASCGCLIACEYRGKPLPNWHHTILSRDEYFHLYPAPDADGWIEWGGGNERPVKGRVDIKNRNGFVVDGADSFIVGWGRDGTFRDIIAYRLHKPEQSKPEFCESVMRSIPEPTAKPTIEQLAADYREAKDYAERKQQEADDAKADAEAKLAELELAGEALGLLVSKQEPELVITDWRDLRVDDIIEYVDGSIKDKIGMTGHVFEFAPNDTDGMMVGMKCDNGPNKGRIGWPMKWRFIRRP